MAFAKEIHAAHIADGTARIVSADDRGSRLEPMSEKEFAARVQEYQNIFYENIIALEEGNLRIEMANERQQIALQNADQVDLTKLV